MRVLLLSGSPKAEGNTAAALAEMKTVFDQDVNFAHAATSARTFSHGVTGFQPRRHGAEPQWSEGLSVPSELFFRCCSSGQ